MLTDLREIATIDHAPGHIQKIVQYEGLIAVASTVSDGMWGNSNRPLDHYNSGGALKVSMKGACEFSTCISPAVKLKKEECTPCPPTCNEEGYVVGRKFSITR